MFEKKPDARRRLMPLAVSLCALTCTAPAWAQTASDEGQSSARKSDRRTGVSQAKPASPNATINLVNMLVKQGVLKEDQADALIRQANDEAYVAREAAKGAATKADEAAKAANAATAAATPPGTRHVTYVPEVVKRQLREEIKREVMDRAHKENWASPGAYPEWAQRIRFSGDLRARYQGSFFPEGNAQLDAINFNAINTGSPYDLNSALNFPTYNTTQDRHQPRLRARLGMEADIYNGFSAGLRIATGENGSPVSTNQTLGAGGGNFSKYALWLDRGFLKYQAFGDNLNVSIGRFDNPFWSPTDLAWHRDLGFDECQQHLRPALRRRCSPGRPEREVLIMHIRITPIAMLLAAAVFCSAAHADKATEEKAKKTLDEVLGKLKAPGADFAAIARAASETKDAGDLGWVGENQIRPEIKALVIGLAKNSVSEATRLDDGWHILKLTDTKAAYTRTLPEVRDQLVQQIRAERAGAMRRAYLAELLKRNPPILNELALSNLLDGSRK